MNHEDCRNSDFGLPWASLPLAWPTRYESHIDIHIHVSKGATQYPLSSVSNEFQWVENRQILSVCPWYCKLSVSVCQLLRLPSPRGAANVRLLRLAYLQSRTREPSCRLFWDFCKSKGSALAKLFNLYILFRYVSVVVGTHRFGRKFSNLTTLSSSFNVGQCLIE